MFELEYKITENDIKSVNRGIMWKYFIPYLAVSLLGLAAGISAVILRPRTDLLVLGIILIVLGALLLACAVLLAVAPKNFFASAVFASDETVRRVSIDGDGITVKTDGSSDIVFRRGEIVKVTRCAVGLLAYVGKDAALIIKDAFTDSHTLAELYGFLRPSGSTGATASERSEAEASADASADASAVESKAVDDEADAVKNAENADEADAEN